MFEMTSLEEILYYATICNYMRLIFICNYINLSFFQLITTFFNLLLLQLWCN